MVGAEGRDDSVKCYSFNLLAALNSQWWGEYAGE